MKISEITEKEVANYLKLDDYEELDEVTRKTLGSMLKTSIQYIKNYTGIPEEELDNSEDFWIVVMVLCQDMFDNHAFYVEKNNVNKVVASILDMHCGNLL